MIATVVIMTKSTMKGGFCITGFELSLRKWIRFVSDATGTPLMGPQTKFLNVPGYLEPLDIVRVNTIREVPANNHTEDVMINYETLSKRGSSRLEAVTRFHPAEEHQYIFGNTLDSLTEQEMNTFKFDYSLVFVNVKDFMITYQQKIDRISCRASFIYNNHKYSGIRITDPIYTSRKEPVKLDEAYLVVSMPKVPFERDGRFYKFAAKIFPLT
ncbi:MAG: hypothetical protein IJU48_10675 [Synergistaceae bacterium]|nr:hypothetical protein [Synergistaceae bacterium]